MIKANFYEKGTSNKKEVSLDLFDNYILINNERYERSDLNIQIVTNVVAIIETSQNDRLEIDYTDFNIELLKKHGYLKKQISFKLLSNKKFFFTSLISLFLACYFIVKFLIPMSANYIAHKVPSSWAQKLESYSFNQIDENFLSESSIDKVRLDKLKELIAQTDLKNYEVIFRKGNQLGANAFALAYKKIIITDELIERMDNNKYIISILLHELGHIENKHVLQSIIRDSFLSFVSVILFGDINQTGETISQISFVLFSRGFSRGHEEEADEFAIKKLNNYPDISAKCFYKALKKLPSYEKHQPGVFKYLSTHPELRERVKIAIKLTKESPDCNKVDSSH